MNLDTFFEKFDLFADAPNAVAKMRELILWLAFASAHESQGKEWPKFLLKQLTTKIGSGSTPDGGRESYFSEGIPLIRSMNVHFGGFRDDGLVYLNEEQAAKLSSVTVQENDVLLNITGASIGRVTTAPHSMVGARVNQHVTIIRCKNELDPIYLSKFLASPLTQNLINKIQVGATRQALTKSMIEQFEIPLPPLAEQKRIVAKVDELMALCDRLEAQQQERETRHSALAQASLTRFADAPTPANLELLFHKSYSIEPAELRKTILALAIQGKLVAQNPDDEPGEAILQRIRFGNSTASPAKTSIDAFARSEVPLDLPSGWSSAKLGSILMPNRGISYGVIKLGPDPQQGGVYVLRCSNVRFRRIDLSGVRKITDDLSLEYRRTILEGGEVLINVRGTLGGCAVVPSSLKGFNIAREVAVIPVHSEISSMFLMNVVASPYFQDKVNDGLRGIAYEGLNLGLLRDFVVPVPPLPEQKRIVAKVEQLMALVDRLEAQLAESRGKAAALLEAVVAELSGVG